MNKGHRVLAAVLATCLSSAFSQTVEIGTNRVSLVFVSEEPRMFDTNRIASAFSKYCAPADGIRDVFLSSEFPLEPGGTVQIEPATYEGGPPRDEAADIVYHAPPDEKIVVGETALGWMLGQLELAAPFADAWSGIDALFAELADGSITNDLARCRETFVVDGEIVTDPASDDEMFRGIQTYWTRLEFFPPTEFGLVRGRLVENGPELTGLRCRYRSPDQLPWETPGCLLVFLDGRWRIVLE